MRHIILSSFLVWLNYRQQTWKIVPKFAQALVYIMFINSSYYYFFKNHILWELQSNNLKLKELRVIHIFIITPLIFLLCMVNLPKEDVRLQIRHILKWSFKCAFVEYMGLKTKMIYFQNGWNIFWSWLIYIFLFSFGYVYTKKPFIIWTVSIPTIFFFIIKFKAPLRRMMLLGPVILLVRRVGLINMMKTFPEDA
ncbi:hypothetical protein N0O92_12385 [Alkalihalobacillus sp. MEB130]|uniref:hypothetical protein n=1 Tax=Alkalihalobacillus sp. MEB130 TaxID=2976704 RepID=UPI0028DE25AA|nr:hypothetical protein [Alkalihalobacillus sp. MEB130]MDT8861032.1 hypothetical protein [Alkalihalobacillus sp. MEB130]